jgi:uncharacterized membrane protein YfcA
MSDLDLALAAAFLVIAALYSSVGHAGASGYIATMALLAVPAATIKPTALALNILVATIGVFRFARAQLVPWRLVLPLIVGSVPLAYLGGALQLPAQVYQRVLAVVLASAAVNLFVTAHRALDKEAGAGVRPMPIPLGLVLGAGLGFVAGLTGTGGAIYLTPLLILAGFATTRIASGASAVFVLVNSISGLLAVAPDPAKLPNALPMWLGAVAVGALIGTQFGRGALPVGSLRRVLAIVLLIAAGKLWWT